MEPFIGSARPADRLGIVTSDDRPAPSQSGAKKAGDRLKRYVRDGGRVGDIGPGHDLHGSLEIVQQWRGRFGPPITGVRMGVISMAKTCGVDADVTQRHKRVERIVQKLARPNSTSLPRMQDIAGVRAVVDDLDDLRRLEDHVRARWSQGESATAGVIVDDADYITRPRASGYRAVHLIVNYNGLLVELQLRTAVQQAWAEMVEQVGRMINLELKAGEEPDELKGFLNRVSVAAAGMEGGDVVRFEETIDLTPWGGQELRVVVEP